MSPQEQGSQPGQESGQPADLSSANPMVRAVERAVDELRTARTYIERDLSEARNDMRDVRDRLARIETRVSDLPSKVWIGTALAMGVAALTGIVTLIMKALGK